MTAKQKDEKMQADIDKAKKEIEIDAIEEEINADSGAVDLTEEEERELGLGKSKEDKEKVKEESKKDKEVETDKLEAEINKLKNDIMEKKLQSELKKKESNIESLSDINEHTAMRIDNIIGKGRNYKDLSEDEIEEAIEKFDLRLSRIVHPEKFEAFKKALIERGFKKYASEIQISAAPKVKEEVKKEQDTSKLPTNMENVEFKEYKNRPKDITPEQKESAIEAPQHIKDEFKELKKTIDDVTKLNSKYEEELSKLKEKYENPITEKSRKSESILKDIYHSAADVQRVNNVVKLSEDLYLGVIEKLNAINKVYDEKEQTKIDAIKEKIKGLNAELKEVQKELGKYTENLKEIKVFTMEASMSEVEIQASAIEEQEIMKDNESILDKIANNFKSFFHTLKDISISLATA
jgi:hypothetical protein